MKEAKVLWIAIVAIVACIGLSPSSYAQTRSTPVSVTNPADIGKAVKAVTPWQWHVSSSGQSYSVPAGKTLVIEHFSATISSIPPDEVYHFVISTRVNQTDVMHVIGVPVGRYLNAMNVQYVHTPVKLYADQAVTIMWLGSNSPPTGYISLSGHLIDNQ